MVSLIVLSQIPVYPKTSDSTKGLITITFDDGYYNIYANASPLMETYGFKGVIFAITSTLLSEGIFEGQKTMGIEEVMKLYLNDWDIQSHSVSHTNLAILPTIQKMRELNISYMTLKRLGFNPTTFAYPYGAYSSSTEMVAEIYRFGRTIVEGLNDLPNENSSNPYLLAVIANHFNIEEIKERIRMAKEGDQWLILALHGVVESEDSLPPQGFGWMTLSDLKEILDEIKTNDVPVKTFSQILGIRKDSRTVSAINTFLYNLTFYDEIEKEWYTNKKILNPPQEEHGFIVWNYGVGKEGSSPNDIIIDLGCKPNFLSVTMAKLSANDVSIFWNDAKITTLTSENPVYTLELEVT